jgi:hypothetical protein
MNTSFAPMRQIEAALMSATQRRAGQ